jgi:hypothetical protein
MEEKEIDKIKRFPVDKSIGDAALEMSKALASFLPLGPNLIESIFTSPLSRRREKWFNEVCEMINELNRKIEEFDINSLISDEKFVTLVIEASHIAIRTHHEEKIKYLKNALQNVAIDSSKFESFDEIFINLIDILTPLHIQVLKHICRISVSISWIGKEFPPRDKGIAEEIQKNISCDRIDILMIVISDLLSKGLIMNESRTLPMGQIFYHVYITEIGKDFFNFIQKPTLN